MASTPDHTIQNQELRAVLPVSLHDTMQQHLCDTGEASGLATHLLNARGEKGSCSGVATAGGPHLERGGQRRSLTTVSKCISLGWGCMAWLHWGDAPDWLISTPGMELGNMSHDHPPWPLL